MEMSTTAPTTDPPVLIIMRNASLRVLSSVSMLRKSDGIREEIGDFDCPNSLLGETVHDATDGRCIEEAHGSMHDTVNGDVVKRGRSAVRVRKVSLSDEQLLGESSLVADVDTAKSHEERSEGLSDS